jgi:cysteine desulfurase/selenocysteine lyase
MREGKPPIYFDNACMTLKPRQVINAMNEYYHNFPACGGHGRSLHWFATEVQKATEEAREKIRSFINAKEVKEIIWTKNTTEGLNLVANCFDLKKGDIVLTTDREHNSNLTPWIELKRRKGIEHKVVRSNEDNSFNMERFEGMMSKKVKLVSMVHTSNLDGYTIPAEEIIKVAHDYGAKVMLDGAQSAPHKPIDVQKLGVDFFAFSVHKMLGPSGMGVLYGKAEEIRELDRFIVGGDTVKDTYYDRAIWQTSPYLYEAGLQNYAGQIGSGVAAEYLLDIGMENISKHEYKLNKYITDGLLEYAEVKILGPLNPEERAGIVSFRIEKKDGSPLIAPRDIANLLDERYNIMIRSGDHCVHSWFNARGIGISGSARGSLYLYNTKQEAEVFLSGIRKIIEENR